LLTSCGHKSFDKPLPNTARVVKVSLPWADGAAIPRRYTCDGANAKPAVRVSRSAPGVAIVMTDPDAPGGTFVHWTSWDGGVEGRNSFGKTGYDGPCPPRGDKPHHYVVTVYLLRHKLGLRAGASPNDVVSAVARGVVAKGSATGTYGR
jgi:phosphatidylethanolamine-binding protein (PEBP) family uncharacterized protein